MSADPKAQWIDAWTQLDALVGEARQMRCKLPDGSDVDVEACKAWLQRAVQEGDRVGVMRGWVQGRPGVHVMRESIAKH